MQSRVTTITAALSAAAFLLVPAAGASATTLHGVVVHDNARAHSFVVAAPGGRLTAIHARHLPRVGRTVALTARPLRNGTWLAQRVVTGQSGKRVVLRGTVTYVRARSHVFVLSARGVSLLVHAHVARHHGVHFAADPSVAVGEIVTVDGSLDGSSVEVSQVHHVGEDMNGMNLEGTIQAIDTTARTLSISADDSGQSGGTVTVQVPASFDLTLFQVGHSDQLIVSPNPDGTYTLEQSSDDTGGRHADSAAEMQGDGHGDEHASAEQQCAVQASDANFAAAHNGVSFTQFYETDANHASNALAHCVDAMAQELGHGSGSEGSGSGSGSGSDSGGSGPEGSGSGGPGSADANSSGSGSHSHD
jgi:uncharacterized membrane protein YgcG